MHLRKKQKMFETNRITYISIDAIAPNPGQPRKQFDAGALAELAESVRQFGILQPLSVRRQNGCFELVAGERRLRAARICGMKEVPCILLGIDAEQSAFLALIENLQRRDLDFIEEAEGLARLILTFGLSQGEAARRLGKSQSAVANKLRILKHSPETIAIIREHALTERHARALLRLVTQEERLDAAKHVAAQGLNVLQTDEYITKRLEAQEPTKEKQRSTYIIKDVRFFMNTLNKAIGMMKASGVSANIDREESEESIRLVIQIDK